MDKKYWFVIGRFQCLPPHKGHCDLIRVLLKEGKNVCIMIRETKRDKNNPYPFWDIWQCFYKIFKKEILNKTILVQHVPDCEGVAWGRKVGWEPREIHLDEETEAISATDIRKKNEKKD